MGDSFQSLVLAEVGAGKGGGVAAQVSSWLIVQGIAKESGQRTSSNGMMELDPGPRAESILDADQPLQAGWNGIQVDPRRSVSAAVQGGVGPVFCPVCHAAMGDGESISDEFMSAVDAWHQGQDGTLACPSCQSASPITKWQTEPFWAFGNVTITFWNWPSLSESFVSDLSKVSGHEVKVVRGKI